MIMKKRAKCLPSINLTIWSIIWLEYVRKLKGELMWQFFSEPRIKGRVMEEGYKRTREERSETLREEWIQDM